MVTRDQLDVLGASLPMPPVFVNGQFSKVNGSLGQYQLWYPKNDRSVLPCLTGEVGGMPGAWENWVTAWHYNVLGDFDTYLDVGANGGYFGFLADTYGKQVTAFEPNPLYVEALKKSKELNGSEMEVVWSAIGDHIGTVDLEVPDELHGSASIKGNIDNKYHTEMFSAPIATLDDYFKARAPIGNVLVKMDIEGSEQDAWHGAREFNEKYRPTYVIEFTPPNYDGFFDELEEYGTVTMIDFTGAEAPVTKQHAENEAEWLMLVIRPWE